MSEPWFVYLLECQSKRIYTGVSPDIASRLKAHSDGRGALFTRINHPEKLLAVKQFATKREALRIEKQVKKMPASGKRILASLWFKEQETIITQN